MLDKIDSINNELIISLYDAMYCYSAKINGVKSLNEFGICLDFEIAEEKGEIIEFMKKYNIHRLIVCEDGCIDIYNREVQNG